MGTRGRRRKEEKRKKREEEEKQKMQPLPPPPPPHQHQSQQPGGGGIGAGKHQTPPLPPPAPQIHPGGAGAVNRKRQPTKNQGEEPGERGPMNQSWSDCSAAFRAEAEHVLFCTTAAAKAEAGRLADSIAAKHQNSALASHLAGRVQANLGDTDRALNHLLHAAKLEPNCLGIAFSLATVHSEMQQYGLAADECRRGLDIVAPCDPVLHAVPPPSPQYPNTSAPAELLRVAMAKDRLRGLLAQVALLPRNLDSVSQFVSGLTEMGNNAMFRIRVQDLLKHLGVKESRVMNSLHSALHFRKESGSWQYWICPTCNSVHPSSDMLMSHVDDKHSTGLQDVLPDVPEQITAEKAEFLRSWSFAKESDAVDVDNSILSEVMRKLAHLNSMSALSVDVFDMLTQQITAPKGLSEITSFDAQGLRNLASSLELIQQSLVVLAHERRTGEEHGFQVDDCITLDLTGDTILLSFGEPGCVDPKTLFSWLCKPLEEKSQVSMIRECLVNGADTLRDMEGMICSLKDLIKRKKSLKDTDDDSFSNKASIDVDILRVSAGLDYVKKKLAKVCTFDYHKIIMPALRSYINEKVHGHILQRGAHQVGTKVSDDNIKRKDSLDEANKQGTPLFTKSFAGILLNLDHDKEVEEQFLKFLKEYRCASRETPFYEGELKAMVHRKSTTFCVYYKHIQEQYAFLGNSIRRSYSRIVPCLNEALKRFIIEQKMVTECKQVSTSLPRVKICDLPEQSVQDFSDFVKDKASILTKKVQIYGIQGDSVIVLSDLGRELYLGYLNFVIEKHRKGESWNGVLSIRDLQVTDRHTFEIAKEASRSATREAMANDFKKLSELLAKYFETTEKQIPIYFTELKSDMCSCLQKLGTYTSDRTHSFQNYILSHLALKSAMARAHLFLDLYRAHQTLGKEDHLKLSTILRSSDSAYDGWITRAQMHPVLRKVVRRGRDKSTSQGHDISSSSTGKDKTKMPSSCTKDESISDKSKPRYECGREHLLIFIRHFMQHGPDHTKDNKSEQNLKSLIETDLIIAKYLPSDAINLIKILLENGTMKQEMFVELWYHFRNSR